MTARTMNDVRSSLREAIGVRWAKVVYMHSQQILSEETATRQVLDRGGLPAIGHVPSAATKPVEHFASAVSEHFKLKRGFG